MNNQGNKKLQLKVSNYLIFFILIGCVLYYMAQWTIPFIIALILGYAFHVPNRTLAQKLHLSSAASAGVIVLLLLSFISIFTIFLLPIFKNAIITLTTNLPHLLQNLPGIINDFIKSTLSRLGIDITFDVGIILQKAITEIISNLPSHITNFANTGLTLVYIIMFLFMTPIITFYLLKDWDKIERFFSGFINKIASETVINILDKIDTKLGLYVKGQLIVCCILSCLYIFGLFLAGVNKYFVCGLLSGILSIAPFFGAFISLLTTCAVSVDTFSSFGQYFVVVLIYLIIPFIDSNFITPRYIGKKTGIQPAWLLFAICSTVSILGTVGIFISVPVAVIFSTVCKELIKKYNFN